MSVICKFPVRDDEGTIIDIYEHGSDIDALSRGARERRSMSVFRTQNGGHVSQIDENTFRIRSGKIFRRVLDGSAA